MAEDTYTRLIALLDENHADEEQAHDDVHDDHEVEKDLHCEAASESARGGEAGREIKMVRRRGLEPLCPCGR